MKTLADLVLFGHPRLYEVCGPMTEAGLPLVMQKVRARYGCGRGTAAPQLDLTKRLVYLHLDGQAHVLLNPALSEQSAAMFELRDDCMCFPNLRVRVRVRVRRRQAMTVTYHNAEWQPRCWPVQGAVAELLQTRVRPPRWHLVHHAGAGWAVVSMAALGCPEGLRTAYTRQAHLASAQRGAAEPKHFFR